MASPDLREYLDWTVYDRDPVELVDRALADATVKLPGWQPHQGDVEVELIESLALVIAELVYSLNRAPAAVVQLLLRLFGVTRSTGTPATADLTFTVADDDVTIPAGFLARLDLGDGGDPILFELDADVVIGPGVFTGTGAATATTSTARPNGVAAGTLLDAITASTVVDTVELDTSPTAGTDPEDDAAWLTRGIQRLRRLTDSLVLAEHFTARALEDVRVVRATTLDNTDSANPAPGGDDPGHVTVVVAGDAGVSLGAPVMAELEAAMEAAAVANLDVHVIAPTVTDVAVVATVRRLAGYSDAEVEANVEAALAAYLDPDAWAWGDTVRRNDLIAVIEGAAGVDYLTAGHPTTPAADVPLAGYGPLARFDAAGSTITVTAP